MFKRMICAALAMMLFLPCLLTAQAEDTDASALSWDELEEWVESYKTRAMETEPLNDPTEDEASSEDGYAFIYDFATLYMDRPEMTEEAQVRSLVITDADEVAPHNTTIDMRTSDVLSSYYTENSNLAGTESFAALYVSNLLPDSASWAWVQRDGQRIMTIQYAVHEQPATGGDGYTDAGLIYTIQDGLVAAIRAYGMDTRITAEEVQTNLEEVSQVSAQSYYTEVPSSTVGTDLTAFGEEDLVFSGVDFLNITPDEAVQELGDAREDDWMQDDTGEYLRTMEFASCTMTFLYDVNKENPKLDVMTIDTDQLEGPRCVRVGDTLSSVIQRFRHSDGDYDEDTSTEMLYGTSGEAPYGLAEYGTDASSTLMYVLSLNGKTVCLHLSFEMMELAEITIYYMD
jgi:hypothetical protein